MIAGEKAPDFTLYDHTGRPRTLSTLLSKGPVVLFFFPIASSPICTAQGCHFRDLGKEFAAVGAQRVGISTDTVDRQAHFAQQRSFDYPLLSDEEGVVSELFGCAEAGSPSCGDPSQPVRRLGVAGTLDAVVCWPAAAGQTGHIRHRHRPHHTQGRRERGARIGARRPGLKVLAEPLCATSFATSCRDRHRRASAAGE
ncbi:ahpC/TSA family protein [Mycobacterium xenopi 3993]|nr:ahpC/TSA family protein [Mycobacterium xenopi 3993]